MHNTLHLSDDVDIVNLQEENEEENLPHLHDSLNSAIQRVEEYTKRKREKCVY